MRKVVGVGINDTKLSGPACTVRDAMGRKYNYPDYAMWYGMLIRCCSDKWKKRDPYNLLSECCSEWLVRSNFQKWYVEQKVYFDNSGATLNLDKDILFEGNKIYSPGTCCLIPAYINTMMHTSNHVIDGTLPMWVVENKSINLRKRYKSAVSIGSTKSKCLGYFLTPEAAHRNSQIHKYVNMLEILDRYQGEPCFRQDVEDAIMVRALRLFNDYENRRMTIRL